jgi:hypothetical protein
MHEVTFTPQRTGSKRHNFSNPVFTNIFPYTDPLWPGYGCGYPAVQLMAFRICLPARRAATSADACIFQNLNPTIGPTGRLGGPALISPESDVSGRGPGGRHPCWCSAGIFLPPHVHWDNDRESPMVQLMAIRNSPPT